MLTIRAYEDQDQAAVWALHNAALRPTGGHAGNGDWDNDLHHIPEVYLAKGGVFLVGLFENEVRAMGALEPVGPGRAEVRRMRVSPGHQRKKAGQQILDRLEKEAVELGLHELFLETTTLQTAAQRFYEKNGYREMERKRIEGFDVIHYEKLLSSKEER